MNLLSSYQLDDSFIKFLIYLPAEAQETEGPVFRFEAEFVIWKKNYVDEYNTELDDDQYDLESVSAMTLVGHTADLATDYLYTADAISESTIENYAFAKGMYEQLQDSAFHDALIEETGIGINRWATFEAVYISQELTLTSEEFQAEIFNNFIMRLTETWRELFNNDVTLLSFSERLYVTDDPNALIEVKDGYKKAGFFSVLHKQKMIEENVYNNQGLKLKDILSQDLGNQLFSEEFKNEKSQHYSGVIFNQRIYGSL
ncbi:hypothetical protein ACTQ5J_07740 [Fundicoccus sp. Sow4_F4]|uniref:hypothetical protein n=1 Tax=Fundicoccus sp. Sow4_F4 TaxID=3438783 RepID=UPI003F8F05C5